MADRPDVASYKLAADTGDFVGPMKAAAGASDELAAAVAKSDVAIEKRGKTVKFSSDYFERQQRKLSDSARIEYQYQKAIEDANKARAAGIGNEQIYNNVIDLQTEKRNRAIAGLALQEAQMRKSSTATGLARYELINLSRQFQDIGVSLAGGQSPLRIIIEQGSQILDVFASSKAAFGQVFSSMIAWAARAATSIVGIATAVVALGVAGGALAISWVEGQRQIERSLIGVGARSGLTVKEVNRISESASQSTKLSISAAREAAIEFIKTGEIYGENVERAVNLTDKFALATGTSAATAAKTLAESLSDPIKGAQELNKEFGFLDGKTLQLIRTLVAAGKEQEAQRVLMEKATPAIKAAADAASGWAKIWMEATQALSIYGTELQKLVTWQERLRAITGPLQPAAGAGRFGAGRAAEQRPAPDPSQLLGLSKLDEQLESLRNKWSRLADEAIRSIFSQIPAIETLKKQLMELKRAQDDAEVKGRQGFGIQNQAAIDAIQLQIRLQNDSIEATKRQVAYTKQIADAYNNSAEEEGKVAVQTALTLNNLDKQIKVLQARNRSSVEAAVNEQKIDQLKQQSKSTEDAVLIIEKERRLLHLQNMTVLKEQLTIAEARTGIAKINAQYEIDINTRLREGATLSEAIAEASLKRQIAIENVNTSIQQQIFALKQENELIEARQNGDEASVRAAQAYTNAIRAGASPMHAMALEAAVLENELVKAAAAASKIGVALGGTLGTRLAKIGTGAGLGGDVGGIPIFSPGGVYRPAALEAPELAAVFYGALRKSASEDRTQDLSYRISIGDPEALQAARAQQDAARAQQDAARTQRGAAQSMQDAIASQISAADEAVKDIVATRLLTGQSAAAINLLIEQGQIQFGTASARFQTQLDLYKRAGASNEQIAADIRAGIIGEGSRPSELLAALEGLTGAVNANTDAQIGLSDFYTQQGDRLLGYRGYNVQTGIRSGAGAGGTGTTGGTTAPGTIGGGVPISGGIVNQSGVPGDPVLQTAPQIRTKLEWSGGQYWVVRYYYTVIDPTKMLSSSNMQYHEVSRTPDTTTSTAPRIIFAEGGIMSSAGRLPLRSYADGGVTNRPQMALFGEGSQPEAFVPLKGGAIPVKLSKAANDDKPATVININAPLVNFMAEPNRDEVRESAFQAAQMLRRVASGGG